MITVINKMITVIIPFQRIRNVNSLEKLKSTHPIYTAIIKVTAITTQVAPINSWRVGQETLVSSTLTSTRKRLILPNIFNIIAHPSILNTGAEGLEPPGRDLESRRLAN